MPYHLNPKTGNANICKAKTRCPYKAVGDPHFENKPEAQKHFEEKMKNPISRGAELTIRRKEIQSSILKEAQENGFSKKIEELIQIRDNIDKAIENIDNDSFSGKITEVVKISSFKIGTEKESYVGFNNDLEAAMSDLHIKDMIGDFEKASTAWVESLSNQEISAVKVFSSSSNSYESYSDSNSEYFLSAIDKSPSFKEPITVYSGLSDEMRNYFENATTGDVVSLDRGISTTLNPGQINAFSHGEKGLRQALIIEAEKGAPLYSVSQNPHELEIILASGEFEIVEIEEDKIFSYSNEMNGLEYSKVFKVRQIT